MIQIEQPSAVLNANSSDLASYLMWYSWRVKRSEPSEKIIEWLATMARRAPGRKFKNLVIQCHGAPGYLEIGGGFTRYNVDLFSGLSGLVDKIWLVACSPAYISPKCNPNGFCLSDGNLFVSAMAKAAQCYVVAPTQLQVNMVKTYPYGVIPSYEGLVLSYGPNGNVTWSHRYPPAAVPLWFFE